VGGSPVFSKPIAAYRSRGHRQFRGSAQKKQAPQRLFHRSADAISA
jgi:hypothetical protein